MNLTPIQLHSTPLTAALGAPDTQPSPPALPRDGRLLWGTYEEGGVLEGGRLGGPLAVDGHSPLQGGGLADVPRGQRQVLHVERAGDRGTGRHERTDLRPETRILWLGVRQRSETDTHTPKALSRVAWLKGASLGVDLLAPCCG